MNLKHWEAKCTKSKSKNNPKNEEKQLYDPENYNVPDRQFAADQKNPVAPILELKKMIQAYHEAGIGVIMDVVYNHTYSSYSSPFQLSVPAYYYRMHDNGSFQDGSGCGYETASE